MEGRGMGKWEAIFKFKKALCMVGEEEEKNPGKLESAFCLF